MHSLSNVSSYLKSSIKPRSYSLWTSKRYSRGFYHHFRNAFCFPKAFSTYHYIGYISPFSRFKPYSLHVFANACTIFHYHLLRFSRLAESVMKRSGIRPSVLLAYSLSLAGYCRWWTIDYGSPSAATSKWRFGLTIRRTDIVLCLIVKLAVNDSLKTGVKFLGSYIL